MNKDDSTDLNSDNHNQSDDQVEITAAAINHKLPTFIPEDPVLWFYQVDATFFILRITNACTKYFFLVANISPEMATTVRDIILTPYAAGHYELLKKALIDRYSMSSSEKIRLVLYKMEMQPNEPPSTFFRRLLRVAEDVLPYNVVLWRFLEKIDSHIANAITAMAEQLQKQYNINQTIDRDTEKMMTLVADSIWSRTTSQISCSISNSNSNNDQHRTRSSSRQQLQQQPRYIEESRNICYFHFKFGTQARRCRPPCRWSRNF